MLDSFLTSVEGLIRIRLAGGGPSLDCGEFALIVVLSQNLYATVT